MNEMQGLGDRQADGSSFSFRGTWQEYLPIALTNFLLTVVTLGIYRFWAKARERRYLWSRTHFIDDSFEWTGTGKEMFIGFLMVMAVLLPALMIINLGVQALVLRGEAFLAGALVFIIYGGIFYLYHVARFRALRYKLSRTWWHGIRGGSDDGGWVYGWSGVWKTVVGTIVLGLLVPWSMTQLWNERWNKMSFGPHPIEARADSSGLMGRWLLIYLVPVIGFFAMAGVGVTGALLGSAAGDEGAMATGMAAMVLGGLIFYLVFLLVSLSFYALFYRHIAEATSVAGIQFEFTARTSDWLKLILGNIGLVIVTLGVGLLVLPFRNWRFIVRHMEAHGTVHLDALTQSATRAPTDAEGIADAFDFGAV
jgi:uncharacterized membrane protein YjgN (DUF898 family)